MNAPVAIVQRKRFTRNQVRDVLFNQGGDCALCGKEVNLAKGDVVEMDHRIPLALGGSNDWSNMQAICKACHGEKTPGDIKSIAKAKRVERKHAGTFRPPRNQIPGAKMTRVKKKLDGSVICRATGEVLRGPRHMGKPV